MPSSADSKRFARRGKIGREVSSGGILKLLEVIVLVVPLAKSKTGRGKILLLSKVERI